MKQIFQVIVQIFGLRATNKPNLPKRKKEALLSYSSGITCIVCNAKNIEITEQGLCESCGSVIM